MGKQKRKIPFAVIGSVAEDSPCFLDGIKPDDLIVNFGEVNYLNHDSFKYLAQHVKANVGKPMQIILLRMFDDASKVAKADHYEDDG